MTIRRPSDIEALRREWYQRLKSDGFEDIESITNPDGPARDRYWSPLDAEGTAEYYRQAADYWRRNARSFPPDQRKVLALHVRGAAYREIAAAIGRSKRHVEATVRAFRARMERTRKHTGRFGPRGRGSVVVSVRLTEQEAERLHSAANRAGRTVAHMVRSFVNACLARSDLGEILAEIARAETE